ncbi:hypothetical protein SAMN05216188_103137 [Lentzea xinjiangensis]|uniref:Lipoprotein n=1 Tax=Lentzea xinjiangensis TaxID=402600 RepID=A0A1H9GAD0_9PSEU|nr:hypothetical protein [Lentzea xinjiangensis]SEQ47020.1 hypothetical protein SAMN05216188_103137 [Lentzea xinjiangensis]
MRNVLLLLVVLLAGCGGGGRTAVPPPGTQTSTSDGIAPDELAPDELAPDELAPDELLALWWTWASQPADTNPVTDGSGRFCMREQPARVWLLAGSPGNGPVERQCRVPADKPLLAPVAHVAGDVTGCEDFMRSARGEVLVNGSARALTRVPATPFTYEARAGNPFGVEAGRIHSVGCGLYAWIDPPPSGEHELVIRGSGGGRDFDVKYGLIVGAD